MCAYLYTHYTYTTDEHTHKRLLMEESNQIIQLLNNENNTFKNISYKSVDRIKRNNINNNSFSYNRIKFNTQAISSSLVPYENLYISLNLV